MNNCQIVYMKINNLTILVRMFTGQIGGTRYKFQSINHHSSPLSHIEKYIFLQLF